MRVKLLAVDEPTETDRLYSKEVVEKAIEEVENIPLPGKFAMSSPKLSIWEINEFKQFGMPEKDLAFLVSDLKIEENALVGHITVLGSPQGKFLQESLDQQQTIKFRPVNITNQGRVGPGVVHIREFHILYFVAIVGMKTVSEDTSHDH